MMLLSSKQIDFLIACSYPGTHGKNPKGNGCFKGNIREHGFGTRLNPTVLSREREAIADSSDSADDLMWFFRIPLDCKWRVAKIGQTP
jgi:hypothetical protein